MKWITIVVLCFNEEQLIHKCLQNVNNLDGISDASVLISDGKSTDGTIQQLPEHTNFIVSEANKARQMNAAMESSESEILWFIHADMKLPKNSLSLIKKTIDAGYDGGGFKNVFDKHNDRIKRLGRIMNFRFLSNKEQSDKGFFYGDNGLFIKREKLMEVGGVPEQEIMEDYELCKRLKSSGGKMFKINESAIVVSSRRHVQTGFVKTRLLWILIRELYKWGVSPTYLRRLYSDNR